MSIDISRVARTVCDVTRTSSSPISLSHAQQYVAAALGFKSLAACQAARRRMVDVHDNSRFLVLDIAMLAWRSQILRSQDAADDLFAALKVSIEQADPGTVVRVTSDRPHSFVGLAIAELVGLGIAEADALEDVTFEIIEDREGQVQGFQFDFQGPAWINFAQDIRARHGSLSVYAPAALRTGIRGAEAVQDRHYLHGDELETSPGRYRCLACDKDVEAEHFEAAHPGKNGTRYFAGVKAWERLIARQKMRQRRSSSSVNLLAAPAGAEREAYERSRAPFHLWIEQQTSRRGRIGVLAKDILRDGRFPVGETTRAGIRGYLARRAHWDGPVIAFAAAWRAFVKDSEVAAT